MEPSTINPAICLLALTLCLSGVVVTFMARTWSPLPAIAGLSALYFWGGTPLPQSQYLFWCGAVAIAWGINVMLPPLVARSRAGVGYISGGALVGAIVGMLFSIAGMIMGSVAGAFCGALAYSRSAAGAAMQFPSSKFLNYLCAKGLPAVVVMCIACICLAAVTVGM